MIPTTRSRSVPALLVLLAIALGACSGDDDGEDAERTRTVTHESGTVEVPLDADVVVALDEYAAVNLLAVGVEPAHVFAGFMTEGTASVLTGEGYELGEIVLQSPSYEDLATLDADLFVATASMIPEVYDALSDVGPTLIIPFGSAWDDVLTFVGDSLGREDEAAAVIDAVGARVDEVAAGLDGGWSLSLLGSFGAGLFSVADDAPASRLLATVGAERPAPQLGTGRGEAGYVTSIADEQLPEHDADVIGVITGSFYLPDAVTGSPLAAGMEGRFEPILGEMWFANTPFAVMWMLDDIESLAAGGSAATLDAVADRWAAYEAAIG